MDRMNGNDSSILMQRIQQLEKERDELQLDVEQLCMHQSGMSSKADAVSQVQNRRIANLKQELEVCKKNLDECMKKKYKLEDELMETYNIKTQFAELLKSETNKNIELEKSIKFFQNSVANAILERDRAILQGEKKQEKEKELSCKICELEDRLKATTDELAAQKKMCQDQQINTEAQQELRINYENLVIFFWEIRSKTNNNANVEDIGDKAKILLGDPESSWVYGDVAKDMVRLQKKIKERDRNMARLQEEYIACNELTDSLKHQIDEMMIMKKEKEDQYVVLKEKMCHLTVMVNEKVKAFSSEIVGFKEYVKSAFREQEHWCKALLEQLKKSNGNFKPLKLDFGVGDELGNQMAFGKEDSYDSDTKEALAIALQDKVATLLLLSQQEERHIWEENKFAAQEYRIAELQKQLFQVTADKAKAFMELASICEDFQRLQEKQQNSALMVQNQLPRRTSASNQMLPANWNKDCVPDSALVPRSMTMENNDWSNGSHQWHVKYWMKGFDYVGSKFANSVSLKTNLKRRDLNTTRLQAQNAALWDILSTLQQICSSAKHLQHTLLKVASTPVGQGHHVTRIIDALIVEAQQLRSSVASCLPVSFTGRTQSESPKNKTDDSKSSLSDAEASGVDIDLLPSFGTTCLDSIILSAEICKAYLDMNGAFTNKLPFLKGL